MNVQKPERKRKSEKLKPEERKQLRQFVNEYSSVTDAACILGIHRNVLDLVLLRGSGSPDTVAAIRSGLSNYAA
jgi:hypothetical protein